MNTVYRQQWLTRVEVSAFIFSFKSYFNIKKALLELYQTELYIFNKTSMLQKEDVNRQILQTFSNIDSMRNYTSPFPDISVPRNNQFSFRVFY